MNDLGVESDIRELGHRMRRLRTGKELTLRDVSERSGLSVSHLSQIERGKCNPSVATLHTVARAMGETFASLFDVRGVGDGGSSRNRPQPVSSLGADQSIPAADERPVEVVRKAMRKGLVMPGRMYEQELLSPDLKRRMEFLWTRIPPGTNTGMYRHEGEECGLILSGSLWMRVANEEFVLNEGDSVYLNSSVDHEFENKGEVTVETIWVITPPSF